MLLSSRDLKFGNSAGRQTVPKSRLPETELDEWMGWEAVLEEAIPVGTFSASHQSIQWSCCGFVYAAPHFLIGWIAKRANKKKNWFNEAIAAVKAETTLITCVAFVLARRHRHRQSAQVRNEMQRMADKRNSVGGWKQSAAQPNYVNGRQRGRRPIDAAIQFISQNFIT